MIVTILSIIAVFSVLTVFCNWWYKHGNQALANEKSRIVWPADSMPSVERNVHDHSVPPSELAEDASIEGILKSVVVMVGNKLFRLDERCVGNKTTVTQQPITRRGRPRGTAKVLQVPSYEAALRVVMRPALSRKARI
jgi:hypothetical protein